MQKKAALIILDGFGITPEQEGNAVLLAKIPFIRSVFDSYPKTLLKASGQEAGLPWGEVGNSEVGHTNIGLGRVVLQDLPQIDKAFRENRFQTKRVIVDAKQYLEKTPANINLIFLCSSGGVHGHIRHIS